MCQVTLDVQFVFVFQNVSDCSLCSVFVSECVRSLSMFSLCFRMCQIALDVQLMFQNVSDRSRSSVCVSECVRLLSVFSLCFKMFQITLDIQFVFLNVSGHS